MLAIQAGAWNTYFTMAGTWINVVHDDVDDVVGRGQIPIVHDQDLLLIENRVGATFGVANNWAVGLEVPVRYVRAGIRYLDTNGQEIELVRPGIHHRNETLVGPGDPLLFARRAWAQGDWVFDARGGLTLPLGRTEEDPFALGSQGLRHQHVQFGTGTVRPVLGGGVARALGGWTLQATTTARLSLYTNVKGYRAGQRLNATLLGVSPEGFRRWRYRLGVAVQGETPERWSDSAVTEAGNQGRYDVLAVAGFSVRLWKLSLAPSVQIPVYTHVVGGQLEYPVVVSLTAGFRPGGGGPDHDHGHDDHDDHDGHDHGKPLPPTAADLDIVDLTDTGELVALEPVPGKVTVFDLWAPWCAPCHELDASLRALVDQHRDELAVRRVNIVEWESPAAKRYLVPGKFNLPHIKVYDAEGNLLFERSGGAEELADAVEALFE